MYRRECRYDNEINSEIMSSRASERSERDPGSHKIFLLDPGYLPLANSGMTKVESGKFAAL